MKKLISLILCMVMLLGMGGQAFADHEVKYATSLQDLIKKYQGYNMPDLDSFCGGELDVSYSDRTNGYVHLCYDSQIGGEALGEYLGLLENKYSFSRSLTDYYQGIYGLDYTKSGVDGFEPGYGYKGKVDVLIVCAGGYSHVYYSEDLTYKDTGERFKGQLYDNKDYKANTKSGGKQEHVSLAIPIPSLEDFCSCMDIYLYTVEKNYVHICYEGEVCEDRLEDYMDTLEDDYHFRLAIYDWTRGIYGYDYYEEDIWTLYPGYGYKDEDDVAFLIVSDDDYTHVYYSIDFDYGGAKASSGGTMLDELVKKYSGKGSAAATPAPKTTPAPTAKPGSSSAGCSYCGGDGRVNKQRIEPGRNGKSEIVRWTEDCIYCGI